MSDFCGDVLDYMTHSCFAEAFVFCNLNMSNNALTLLDNVKLIDEEGLVLKDDSDVKNINENLFNFFLNQSNNEHTSKTLSAELGDILANFKSHSKCGLTLQSKYSDSTDDNILYHRDNWVEYHVFIYFKGPHTLFIKPSDEQKQELIAIEKEFDGDDLAISKAQTALLANTPVYTANINEAAIMRLGYEAGAWHSGPLSYEGSRLLANMPYC
jgi:hypothetical protein